MTYNIAVVGATGIVGHEILNILVERRFPFDKVVAVASDRSRGKEVSLGDKTLKVKALYENSYDNVNLPVAFIQDAKYGPGPKGEMLSVVLNYTDE